MALWWSPAAADETVSCDTGRSQSVYEQTVCASRHNDLVDVELLRVYRATRAAIKQQRGADAERNLVEAQRAWIAWRDKEVELCVQSSGVTPEASMFGLATHRCKGVLLQSRSDDLRGYLRQLTSTGSATPSSSAAPRTPAEEAATKARRNVPVGEPQTPLADAEFPGRVVAAIRVAQRKCTNVVKSVDVAHGWGEEEPSCDGRVAQWKKTWRTGSSHVKVRCTYDLERSTGSILVIHEHRPHYEKYRHRRR